KCPITKGDSKKKRKRRNGELQHLPSTRLLKQSHPTLEFPSKANVHHEALSSMIFSRESPPSLLVLSSTTSAPPSTSREMPRLLSGSPSR
ncbi:UNVERIFIED_CONTAM: hypothetical protein GTU68_054737, partial [Idotea baltica]|nr:hypothetical protein [Idotea baltica]